MQKEETLGGLPWGDYEASMWRYLVGIGCVGLTLRRPFKRDSNVVIVNHLVSIYKVPGIVTGSGNPEVNQSRAILVSQVFIV